MKKLCAVLCLALLMGAGVYAQQKYALVIGNGNYNTIERLANPVKDSTDIAAKLRTLGYEVDLQINVGKVAMDRAIQNYMNLLARDRNNEGFFWFAGHGVQIEGENYLLPVDVDATDNLSVKHTSYSVSYLTDSFDQRAKNKVNIVVLDACRNNPFRNMAGGNRSLSRGLSVIQDLPSDLLIIYSTAAGEIAADGAAGRPNSPFAEAFLANMDSSEDITIVVRSITRETLRLTNNVQRPFTSGSIVTLEYYSLNPVQLPTPVAPQPAAPVASVPVQPAPPVIAVPGKQPLMILGIIAIIIVILSFAIFFLMVHSRHLRLVPATPGTAPVQPSPSDQPSSAPAPRPAQPAFSSATRTAPANMVLIKGGTFMMGSPANEPGRNADREGPQHQVTVSSFYMGKYEITQKEYQAVMGTNPSRFKGDNLPVEQVTWYDAVEYCNRLSQREGLTPAYTINGTNVTWNRNANGYRLPTEAEWEYACRAGTTTAYNTGASISNDTGWYKSNSSSTTHLVGQKPANRWGLYDMHGNVWEWCWDWFGDYSSGAQTDPSGAVSGDYRVFRGGAWYGNGQLARSAYRSLSDPSYRVDGLGFRLVRP